MSLDELKELVEAPLDDDVQCHRRAGESRILSTPVEGIQRVDAEPAAPARGRAAIFEGV